MLRAASDAWARASIARGSKSFALASRLFEPETRRRATLLYAWCRHCDDVIDEQVAGHGHAPDPRPMLTRLELLREDTLDALNGAPDAQPPFAAIARVAAETRMPRRAARATMSKNCGCSIGSPSSGDCSAMRSASAASYA